MKNPRSRSLTGRGPKLPLRLVAMVFWFAGISGGSLLAQTGAIDFVRDIRPVLSDNCFACHGPDEAQRDSGLRLDIEAEAKDYVIVENSARDSELIERINSTDEDELMPPADSGKSLTDQQKQLLARWIDEGANWSDHWAYVLPEKHPVPAISRTQWPKNWIDHFVVANLSNSLSPSADADRVTLVRRLYFDLIGLPPSPDQVADFLADDSEENYQKTVTDLLGSPHFGERMAVYWLDLVRYADTVGYHGDQDHNISPYRDWVIDALNENMAFDQFTREQLAGDLLPDSSIDQKIASGYNRLLQTSHEGGVQPREYMAIYAADRVRNLSAVWLAATLGCAQCHDHKYDPYTMRDFYSMEAFFADLDDNQHFKKGTNTLPTKRPPEIEVLSRKDRQARAGLAEKIDQLKLLLENPEQQQREELVTQLQACEAAVTEIDSRKRLTMVSVALLQPRVTRILPRGNWLDDSGSIVQPAVPEFLGKIKTNQPLASRLDLANWLTDAGDGAGLLTARVFANRFWYLFFGRGISADLADLGGQGQPPVAPQLLDNLAIEFVGSGWDVKHLVRMMVSSRTYRQSSRASTDMRRLDPENRWFARQTSFRLPAEFVRDNALAISGLLVRETGGSSVKPYQPAGYYRHLNFPKREYSHDRSRGQWRRGVYVHWQRQFLHPMLKSMDAPMREECTAARPQSNTPLAALALLNDPSFVEMARVFAERIVSQGGDSFEQRLEFAVRWSLSRSPTESESEIFRRLFESSLQYFGSHELAPGKKELLETGLAPQSNLPAVEVAAWTSVARAIFNLDETITRN